MEQQKQVLYRGFGTQKPGGLLANMFDIRDKVPWDSRPLQLERMLVAFLMLR